MDTLLQVFRWQYFINVIDYCAPAYYSGHSGEMSASVFVGPGSSNLSWFEEHSKEKKGLLGQEEESSTTAGKGLKSQ